MLKEFVGYRVKELRMSKTSLNQNDFSKLINVDRTYLSRVESGKQNLTLDKLEVICNTLNITISDFFKPLEQDR